MPSAPSAAALHAFTIRQPTVGDGPAVTALINSCPPLDANSPYCHLIQCLHFAETCLVAERANEVVGWVSAYRPPADPDQIFVWQVAVHPSARGMGLGALMLQALVERPAAKGAGALTATITDGNRASWALFIAFARERRVPLVRTPLFDGAAHFAGAHETEWQASIALHAHSPQSAKETA